MHQLNDISGVTQETDLLSVTGLTVIRSSHDLMSYSGIEGHIQVGSRRSIGVFSFLVVNFLVQFLI